MKVFFILYFVCFIFLGLPKSAMAGFLVGGGPTWNVFSMQPEDDEATPNYQGIGGQFKLGYSFQQIFDISAHVQYSPGNVGMVKLEGEGANLAFYGGEVAARILGSVYFALRGGKAYYQLLKKTREDEITGAWQGPAGGFSLGGIVPLNKYNFIQISCDFLHLVASREGGNANELDEESGKRRVDQFSIAINYIYNGYKNSVIENSFFSQYLNSILFWE
ncbi:MAG: hypothetical protein R3B45_14805 [Bdellovibrionota bacterium]